MSILPGIRHLRAPLAAGSIWAICLWFCFGTKIKDQPSNAPFIRDSFDLAHLLGRTITFGILAICVYTIGAISSGISHQINITLKKVSRSMHLPPKFIPSQRLDEPGEHALSIYFLHTLSSRFLLDDAFSEYLAARKLSNSSSALNSDASMSNLMEAIIVAARDDSIVREKLIYNLVDIESYALEVNKDRMRLLKKLAVLEPEIYNLVDMHLAESQFLNFLILPISVLGLIITFKYSAFGLILLVFAFMLLQVGDAFGTRGLSFLYAAITAGKLSEDFRGLTTGRPTLRALALE